MDPNLREQVRLVELDYDRTNKFIEGVVGSGMTIKGWAITLSLALLGVAFDREAWQIGALAIVVTLMFGLIDAYHSWLYLQAVAHASATGKVLSYYYSALGRGRIDPLSIERFEVELDVHHFGLFRNLSRLRFRDIFRVRPRFVLVTLYSILLLVGFVGTIMIAISARSDEQLEPPLHWYVTERGVVDRV